MLSQSDIYNLFEGTDSMVFGYIKHLLESPGTDSDQRDPRYIHTRGLEDDCLSCRITGKMYCRKEQISSYLLRLGSMTMIGLGGYTYYSGMANLRKQRQAIAASSTKFGYRSRQAGIVTIALSLASVGVFRIFN